MNNRPILDGVILLILAGVSLGFGWMSDRNLGRFKDLLFKHVNEAEIIERIERFEISKNPDYNLKIFCRKVIPSDDRYIELRKKEVLGLFEKSHFYSLLSIIFGICFFGYSIVRYIQTQAP